MKNRNINLRRMWRRTLWQVYDDIWPVIFLSLLWIVFSFTIILLPAASAGLFCAMRPVIYGKSAHFGLFFTGMKQFFFRSTALFFIYAGTMCLLLFNTIFYAHRFGFAGLILSGINFWLCFFAFNISIYILPILLKYEYIGKTIKHSFIYFFSGVRAYIPVCLFCVIIISAGIIIPIIAPAFLAVFIQNAFLEYEALINGNIEIPDVKRRLSGIWKIWEFS